MPDAAPSPFTHAVASFDPTADGVLLWTRVDPEAWPASGRVTWHVSRDAAATDVVADGTADIPPDGDGCVTVAVGGLEPATSYHYWFDLDGVLSPLGRTRTLPAGPTEWFRLALVCCADPAHPPLTAYRAAAEDEVDLVLHLGDYLYETASPNHDVAPDRTCITLDDYRERHAFVRADPDVQALHLRHPMVFVWDDHDVADNAWRGGAKAHDPERHGPWADRLLAAATARQEWLPARLRDPGDLLAMWRSLKIGDLAELVVLDTRIPGRDQQAGDEGARPLQDPQRSLLGDDQRAWAHERIRDVERPWCLLATAVVLSPLQLPVPAGSAIDAAMPSGYRVVDGEALCSDEWDGYPVERRTLLNVVAERGGGTVLLSGDVHSAWAIETQNSPGTPPVAVELVCPAVSSTPMGEQLPGDAAPAERAADVVPGQRWHDLDHHGYVRVDVRPDEVRADWFSVDQARPEAPPELLASWAVDRSFPPVLTRSVPSIPAAATGTRDVVRDGLPLDVLPPPREPAGTSGSRRSRARLAMIVVLVAAALIALRRRRIRRLGRRAAPGSWRRRRRSD